MRERFLIAAVLICVASGFAQAAPPELIRYQARLTDDAGVPLTGSRNLSFAIYDAASDGSLQDSILSRARVRNHAKLAYNGVSAWLEGNAAAPEGIDSVDGLAENLRLQDRTAQRMKQFRNAHGALNLETIEAKPFFEGDEVRTLKVARKNRANHIIEDFMIAANGVAARFLESKRYPSLHRVVRTPKRWDRIVKIAAERGAALPADPDSRALDDFLIRQKAADPLRFPDLSLTVIKLLGSGEYVAELRGEQAPGHFGLAVKDYAHSTAPNRRFPDLITQRLLKAAMQNGRIPYGGKELLLFRPYGERIGTERESQDRTGKEDPPHDCGYGCHTVSPVS